MPPTTELVAPDAVWNMLAGPSFLHIDLRGVLKHGVLPNGRVLRRRANEDLDAAMERLIEAVMYETPPEDTSKALLLTRDDPSDDSEEVAAEVQAVSDW